MPDNHPADPGFPQTPGPKPQQTETPRPETAGPAIDSIVDVRAEKWVQQGFCLGYLPARSGGEGSEEAVSTSGGESRPDGSATKSVGGFPIFLHGALPGEDVRVRITRSNNRHCFGLVEEVLNPAANRRESDCAVFPQCGGCSFRHIDYTSEIELKLSLLAELKYLQSCIDAARERDQYQVHSGEANDYRTRARLHRASKTDPPGFYELHSNRIVPLPADTGCRQLSPDLNEAALEEIRQANAGAAATAARRPQSEARNDLNNPRRASNPRHHALQLELDDPTEIDGRPWLIPGGAFFQANQFLLTDWLQAARRMMVDQTARVAGQNPAAANSKAPATLELFCGSGLLGGCMRDLLGDYVGYDNAPAGLKAARGNFKQRGYAGRFENFDLYRRPVAVPRGTALALINPPRAGMNQRQIPLLAEANVHTILYSSCNPATLNRDLGKFLERGYQARAVEIFDFFPRTPHLEVLILLEQAD
jgi:tRNA/tmRNA/rRNA uracil-C5-methylase (TrmA/RlmC/RlmD family)